MGKRNITKSVPMGAAVSPLTLARIQVLARDNNRTVSAEVSSLLDGVLENPNLIERILTAAREQDASDTQRGKTDPRTPARQVLANLAGQITAAPAVPAANVVPAKVGPKLVPPVSAQPPAPTEDEPFSTDLADVPEEKQSLILENVRQLLAKVNDLLNRGVSPADVAAETGLTLEDVRLLIVKRRQIAAERSAASAPPRLSEPEKVLEELLPPEQRGPRVEPAYAQPEFTLDEMVPIDAPLTLSVPAPAEKVAPEGNPPTPDPAPVVDDAPADPLPPGASVPRGLLIRGDDE